MLLHIIVDDTMYTEMLEAGIPLLWDRAMSGLRMWSKAVNAVELKRVLSGHPKMAHLLAEHLISPGEYSPLGGSPVW